MRMESFNNSPMPQKKVEKPKMTFGERIGKGKDEDDPKWKTAGQKIDLINAALAKLGEKNDAENSRRMKESASDSNKFFEMAGKEEYEALMSGYDALKDLYMAEESETDGPEKWEKQKVAQKALEIAERVVGNKYSIN